MNTNGHKKMIDHGFHRWTRILEYQSALVSSPGTFLDASICESCLGRARRTLFADCELTEIRGVEQASSFGLFLLENGVVGV